MSVSLVFEKTWINCLWYRAFQSGGLLLRNCCITFVCQYNYVTGAIVIRNSSCNWIDCIKLYVWEGRKEVLIKIIFLCCGVKCSTSCNWFQAAAIPYKSMMFCIWICCSVFVSVLPEYIKLCCWICLIIFMCKKPKSKSIRKEIECKNVFV